MKHLLLLASLLALTAWVWTCSNTDPGSTPQSQAHLSTKDAGPEAFAGVAQETGAAGTRQAVSRGIVVLDAATKAPIQGVKLVVPSAPDGRLLPENAISESSADGFLDLESADGSPAFLIAAGYLPHPLQATDVSAGSAQLLAGQSLRFRVLSSLGNPLAGASLVLRGSASADHSIANGAACVGNPYATDPEWVAHTDARGEATINGLPIKSYRIREWLDGHYPLTLHAAHREVVPPADLTLVMGEVWGCVAELPEGLQVATWKWSADGELDTGIHVLSSLEPNRLALERRFPNSLCVVGVPRNPDRPAIMTGTATMTNGSVWQVSWPLARWKDIAPVFLEQQAATTAREIRIVLEDPRGQSLDLPIAVYDKVYRTRIPAQRGSCMLVPGSYQVVPELVSPWLKAELVGASFEVTPALPPGDTVVVPIRETLHRVTIALEVEPAGRNAVARIRFLDAANNNATILRKPSDPLPCLMHLPSGKFRIRASGLHYESAEHEVEVKEDVALTLRLDRIAR